VYTPAHYFRATDFILVKFHIRRCYNFSASVRCTQQRRRRRRRRKSPVFAVRYIYRSEHIYHAQYNIIYNMFAVNSFFSCALFHSARRRRRRAFTIDYFRNFVTLTAINRKKPIFFFFSLSANDPPLSRAHRPPLTYNRLLDFKSEITANTILFVVKSSIIHRNN